MSSDINNPKTYWNGKLSGKPNMLYNKFVNYDVTGNTYSNYGQRKKATSFMLTKRQAYKRHVLTTRFEGWRVTDFIEMDESSCSNKKCYEFFYLVKDANIKIIGSECGSCDDFFSVYEGCRCECQYDRFLTTDFVRGIPRKISNAGLTNSRIGNTGIQVNTTGALSQGFFTDNLTFNYAAGNNGITIGDYVYVWGSPNTTGSAYCGQVRQILDIGQLQGGPDDDFALSTPWSNFAPSQLTATDAQYSIFPEWGKVFMFATCEGIKIFHDVNNRYDVVDGEPTPSGTPFLTTVCDYTIGLNGTVQCVAGMQEYKGRINLLFDNGFNAFGGAGFDKMSLSLDSYNLVGPDKIASVAFRNFLLTFGKSSIGVLTYNEDTQLNSAQNLRTNLGIWSKYAYTEFDNSFFFVASDKRLYALSVKADGGTYVLDLQDMSDIIRGDLDMLQPNDEVFLYADGQRLSIFINGRNNQSNSDTTKTKILNFDRDYGVWTEHQVSLVISGKIREYFIGDGLFSYCGTKDGGSTLYIPGQENDGFYFDAYVEAFIGENEENGTELNMFTRKQLNWIKVILGRGIYTNDNTVLYVDQYSGGYKAQYAVSNIESIEWVRNNNAIINGTKDSIEPTVCIIDNLNDYNTIERPCAESFEQIQQTEVQGCGCPPTQQQFDDYAICVDDKAYALSETYTLNIPLSEATMESDLFRIRLYSKGGDTMVFGGMLLEVEQQPIEQGDPDGLDVIVNDGCCSLTYCP